MVGCWCWEPVGKTTHRVLSFSSGSLCTEACLSFVSKLRIPYDSTPLLPLALSCLFLLFSGGYPASNALSYRYPFRHPPFYFSVRQTGTPPRLRFLSLPTEVDPTLRGFAFLGFRQFLCAVCAATRTCVSCQCCGFGSTMLNIGGS
jgi:hypothetical protein